MKNVTLSVLKNLTPKKCVELAKFLYPNLDWKYCYDQGGNPWDGHDVVVESDGEYLHILQIDYREQINQEWARVCYYDDVFGSPFPIDENKVKQFLNQ